MGPGSRKALPPALTSPSSAEALVGLYRERMEGPLPEADPTPGLRWNPSETLSHCPLDGRTLGFAHPMRPFAVVRLGALSAVPYQVAGAPWGATRQSEGMLRVRGHVCLHTRGPAPSGRSRTTNPCGKAVGRRFDGGDSSARRPLVRRAEEHRAAPAAPFLGTARENGPTTTDAGTSGLDGPWHSLAQ